MATSGNFLTSASGTGGGNFYDRMIFEWWRTGSGYSGSVGYHNISYHLKTYGGSTGYWVSFYQGSMNVDGTGRSFASPTKAYGGGATVFGDYSKTLYTNSAGNRSFSASAQGGIYYNTINTTGSGSWSLPNIPLNATLTALSMGSGGVTAYDEGPMWLEYSNPAGGTVHSFVESPVGGSNRIWTDTGGSRHNFTFDTSHIEALQQSSPNSNSFTIRIGIYDTVTGTTHYDYRDRTMYIKNDAGQANPNFDSFTYADTNSATIAVTGDDQILIQGKSTLDVTVPSGSAATANKFANMNSYIVSVGGYSSSLGYSDSVDVTKSVGVVSDVSGLQNISVRAIDSRGNGKTVTTQTTVVPYASPYFVPSLTVKYTNDFDDSSGLTVTSTDSNIATISPMTYSGSDLNSVNTTSGIQFDLSKGGNTSYTGTWEDVASSRTAGSSSVTATYATIASDILTKMNTIGADNTVKWYIKFKITDALETQYYETFIDIGKPIFRIGTDGNVYNNEKRIAPLSEYYAWNATKTSNQTTVSDNTVKVIAFQSVEEYRDTTQFSSDAWEAPADGWVSVSAVLSIIGGAAADDSMNWGIYVNGSVKKEVGDNWYYHSASAGVEFNTTITAGFKVSAGDTIDIRYDGQAHAETLMANLCHFSGSFTPNP